MEVPQLTALQKAKQKYYASKKATISEAKKKVYAEKIQALADDEIERIRKTRQLKNLEKKSKMTPEEMANKKQKQAEYKAKYNNEHKAYLAEREQEGYERALKRWEKDPIYNKKPVDPLQKKKTRGPNKKTKKEEEEEKEEEQEKDEEEKEEEEENLSLNQENIILSISENCKPQDKNILSLKFPEEPYNIENTIVESKTSQELAPVLPIATEISSFLRILTYYDDDLEEDISFEEMSEEDRFCIPRDEEHKQRQIEYKFKFLKYRQYEQFKALERMRE